MLLTVILIGRPFEVFLLRLLYLLHAYPYLASPSVILMMKLLLLLLKLVNDLIEFASLVVKISVKHLVPLLALGQLLRLDRALLAVALEVNVILARARGGEDTSEVGGTLGQSLGVVHNRVDIVPH